MNLPKIPILPAAKVSGEPDTVVKIFESTDRYLALIKPSIVKMDMAYYNGRLNEAQIVSLCNVIRHHPEILFVLPVGFVVKGKQGKNEDIEENQPWPARCGGTNIVKTTIVEVDGRLPPNADYGLKAIDVGAYGLDVLNPTPFGTPIKLYGTCVATNFVTAAAVRALSENPNLSVAQLKTSVLNSAAAHKSLLGKVKSGKFVGLMRKN
jgi:hypothetical protein